MRLSGPFCFALVLSVAFVSQTEAHSRGALPGYTGADFPGENSRACTLCHTGSEINSGEGTLALLIGESPAEEHSYNPGATVSLIVSFADSSAARLGFQVTARSGDGCGPAGELATTDTDDGAQIKIISGTCGPRSRSVQWATHTLPRAGQSATFEIAWTAPAESVGPITIAVAGNGADGSLNARGDKIYTAQATLQPAAPEPELGPPVISDGGVTMLGDGETPLSTAAPGAVAAISGTDFAAADTTHAGGVAEDGTWATAAGGVCVEVNQVRAPVLHVAADRILFQVPPGTAAGSAAVQVVRECDSPMDGPQEVRSSVATLQVAIVQPALFQFSDSVSGLAALHADYSIVGEEGLDLFPTPAAEDEGETAMPPADEGEMAGTDDMPDAEVPPANPRPAMPGDLVTVLAAGLGATEPALASGEIALWPHTVSAESVKAMVGQLEVPASDLAFAGATAGFAGLYLVSFRVPAAAPAGDHAVSLLVDNAASPAGAMLAVALPPTPEPTPDPDPMPGDPGGGTDDEQTCVVGLVLEPGDSCVGEIYSVNLGGVTIPGRFEVRESGEGCLAITGGAFQALIPQPICEEQRHNPLGANLFVAERGEDSSSWTIVTLVGPPEEEP